MELSLESAFSTGGMVGHLTYVLLVSSMLMRTLFLLRILVIASALVAIVYASVWLRDPVSTFWEVLLVLVNVLQILREWRNNQRARFSPEEQQFVDERLPNLNPGDARHLLNLGTWMDGLEGTVLTTEGSPVQNLVYLASGQVDISLNGDIVGVCMPGNFVGEMSVLEGGDASATSRIAQPSRYWLIPAVQLRALQTKSPQIAAAFDVGIARDLRSKLIYANQDRLTT